MAGPCQQNIFLVILSWWSNFLYNLLEKIFIDKWINCSPWPQLKSTIHLRMADILIIATKQRNAQYLMCHYCLVFYLCTFFPHLSRILLNCWKLFPNHRPDHHMYRKSYCHHKYPHQHSSIYCFSCIDFQFCKII